MPDPSTSTDASRTGGPLPHARLARVGDLALELGGTLPDVRVCYETWGTLHPARDNAVLVCHALSGDSHCAAHDATDAPGWWDLMVGPGRPVDTDRFFVVCSNVLGGCRGTTGPGSLSAAKVPYGADFPDVTLGDLVEAQRRLLDHLDIPRLHAVVGGSLGGHQALTWATRHPGRVARCALLATSPRLSAQALAFDVVGRNAILRDPHYHGGQYYAAATKPDTGLALARMLGHITYLSREAMTLKFDADRHRPRDVDTAFEKLFGVGSYLAYQGKRFVERFDANSYVTLTRAMDRFDLGATADELRASLAPAACAWLVLSFTSDWLFPPEQGRALADALLGGGKPVTYCNVRSDAGHDAFLLEENFETYGGLVRSFLGCELDAPCGEPVPSVARARVDDKLILDLVPVGSRVLDLGCGDGALLALLARERAPRQLLGVELDERSVVATAARGLHVVQHDLEEPLAGFADASFDVVVLSQTLQAVADTAGIIDEMLRVGRRAVVSFPNFAFRAMRQMLSEQGRSPKMPGGALGHEWYDSPNVRFASIVDFEEFCRARGVQIEREVFLDTVAGTTVTDDPNLNADLAVFVLAKSP